MRVGAYQFDVVRGDVNANLERALEGVVAAARAGLRLVCLPEMWPTSFPSTADAAPALIEPACDAVAALAERADDLGIVVAGSALAASDSERPFNRLHLLSGGRDVLGYDKLHLFSPTGEGLAFSAGSTRPRAVEIDGLRVGGVVCYDLRFAPTIEALAEQAVDLIVVPAQWPTQRLSHWRALLRGRAVEAQCFVLGANRVGEEPLGKRRTLSFSGASSLIAPNGNVLAELSDHPGLVAADIDITDVKRMRRNVPVARDRRDGLYEFWSRTRE